MVLKKYIATHYILKTMPVFYFNLPVKIEFSNA